MSANRSWIQFLPPLLRSKLENQSALQKILSNIGWLFADRILRMGVGLFVGVWVARYLGPEQFGLYSYVFAIVGLFSVLASLGLDTIVIRDIVCSPERKDELLGTTFALKLFSGVTNWLLAIGCIILIRPGDSLSHWLMGIVAARLIFQTFDTIDFWFQAQVQSKYTVIAQNTAFLVTTLFKIWLILHQATLIMFAWVTLLEVCLGAIGLLIGYRVSGNLLSLWRASLPVAKKLLQDSWPLILSGIVIIIYMRIDQVMLNQQVGNQETGLYAAAVKLAEVWYFLPLTITASVFPSIIEAKQNSESLFYQKVQKLYQLMSFLSYLVAIPVTFLSGWIIQIVFGSTYGKSAPMLIILIWSGLFVNLGVVRSSFLNAMNWNRLYLMTVSLGCLLNILLNLVLIPIYGGVGAATATLIAYWFATHGACFLNKSLFKTGRMLTKAMFLLGD